MTSTNKAGKSIDMSWVKGTEFKSSPDFEMLKTQKARGIWKLATGSPGLIVNGLLGPQVYGILPHTPLYKTIPLWEQPYYNNKSELSIFDSYNHNSLFARPCPTQPRHGFVESRVVKTNHAIEKLYIEARKEDPNAEVVLMPVLSGKYSGIATNAGVTYGFGNDGVTSATSQTIDIPAVTTPDRWNNIVSRYTYGYSHRPLPTEAFAKDFPDTVYMELVENDRTLNVVQIRNGPVQSNNPNYIPKKTKVKSIVEISHIDLLTWERTLRRIVRDNSGPDGLVLVAPNTPLSSHYLVHAIQLGMAVVTGNDEVKKGMVLKPTENVVAPLTKADYAAIAPQIAEELKKTLAYSDRHTISTSIATMHAMPQWDNRPVLIQLRAFAAANIARFATAACLGEMRHWYGAGPGRYGDKPNTDCQDYITKENVSRNVVYDGVLDGTWPLEKLHTIIKANARDFRNKNWRGGMGGRRWASVAFAGVRYINWLRHFTKRPTEANWNRVVHTMNNLINSAHNNGKVFTKWISSSQMWQISEVPVVGFINTVAAEIALATIKQETPNV